MKFLVELVKGIFSAIFEVLMKNPRKERDKVEDIGRKQPDDPDKAFSDTDW